MIAFPVPKLLQRLFGKIFALLGLCLSEVSSSVVGDSWGATDYQTATQHEKSLDSSGRALAATQTQGLLRR